MTIEERYPEILRAALDVFALRGYERASIREIAARAGLSLAGLYHYVGGKEELLFLVLDHSLDELMAALDERLARARTPHAKLLALVETHLDFALQRPAALKIINRDWEMLLEPKRSEIAAKRGAYLSRGLGILREIDPLGGTEDELSSATNLLLGMLNGIATRPFLRSDDETRSLSRTVARLFLNGFLHRTLDLSDAEMALRRDS
ncbi:MAG: TetR family transcriptional regulator [Planctomycetes bacterium]|nr:TetR family transcriptional regulator [Planctomycetota bacterium]MBI3845492.1 TetR family transcriptional regulator [Planctomycetota bacterium]